jgi:hypothetical protein
MKTLKSKRDTRRKIQLGELIKKAGLDTEENSVIYGLLLEAQEKLQNKNSKNADTVRQHWRVKGDIGDSSGEAPNRNVKKAVSL